MRKTLKACSELPKYKKCEVLASQNVPDALRIFTEKEYADLIYPNENLSKHLKIMYERYRNFVLDLNTLRSNLSEIAQNASEI